ncbi:hypothetical protein RI367_004723 [Sorochytrium milnesiophthora]
MQLAQVLLPTDAYYGMLTHALTTEREEVMGLLLGDWKVDHCIWMAPFWTAHISAVTQLAKEKGEDAYCVEISSLMVLKRMDKRPDRVEIASNQLIFAMQQAEVGTGDLQTQGTQQMADPRFVGLIVSCFHKEVDLSQRIRLTAFQTNAYGERQSIPIVMRTSRSISPQVLPVMTSIASSLYNELCTTHALSGADASSIVLDEPNTAAAAEPTGSDMEATSSTLRQLPSGKLSMQQTANFSSGVAALTGSILQPFLDVYRQRSQECDEQIEFLQRAIAQQRQDAPPPMPSFAQATTSGNLIEL